MFVHPSSSSVVVVLAAFFFGVGCLEVRARNFRVARIPNGTAAGCANCHVNPGGGGPRTPFGAAVNTILGGVSTNVTFWSATLAALDSDGDGLTNGGELLDPDGDGTPTGSTGVTNPGNRPPEINSSPVTSATMGIAYNSGATATDAESNGIVFSKVAGPAWLSVSTSGIVSGLPPAGSSGSHTVTVRASDTGTSTKGFSLGSTTQIYTLVVISSFTGWQALTFLLPTEAALAAPLADPDRDGLVNLLEYTVRLPARTGSAPGYFSTAIDGAGRLATILNVRDDDPKLSVVMEAADGPGFASVTTITPTITDPVPGDGFRQYAFVDAVGSPQIAARFVRLRISLLP